MILWSKRWTSRSRPYLSMLPRDIFRALERNHQSAKLYRAVTDALMTENAARLARMQRAAKSVDNKSEDLVSQMRAAHQDQIASALLDIIIGLEEVRKGT